MMRSSLKSGLPLLAQNKSMYESSDGAGFLTKKSIPLLILILAGKSILQYFEFLQFKGFLFLEIVKNETPVNIP